MPSTRARRTGAARSVARACSASSSVLAEVADQGYAVAASSPSDQPLRNAAVAPISAKNRGTYGAVSSV